jgi:beta-lactamase regulating signal transducer with metallopeptidase domain
MKGFAYLIIVLNVIGLFILANLFILNLGTIDFAPTKTQYLNQASESKIKSSNNLEELREESLKWYNRSLENRRQASIQTKKIVRLIWVIGVIILLNIVFSIITVFKKVNHAKLSPAGGG